MEVGIKFQYDLGPTPLRGTYVIQYNKWSLHRCIAYGGRLDMGTVDVVVLDMAAFYRLL